MNDEIYLLNFSAMKLWKETILQNTSGFNYMCLEYGVFDGTLHEKPWRLDDLATLQ